MPGTFDDCPMVNWSSPQQVAEVLTRIGHPVESTADEVLATIDHPIADLLRQHREASKKATTYGNPWVAKHVAEDGRVYPRWKQLGADSGRMSCADPNMQQLPRDPAYRCCVVAPPGRILIKADYSQIELRIAAKISGDKAMMAAYREGRDLHRQTAAVLLGKPEAEVTKDDRQIAKSANFGLLYGMGAPGYQSYAKTMYGVSMTLDEAREYRAKFFRAYPGLVAWHRKAGAGKDQAIDTRTLTGRRRRGITRFTQKLNTPVQGTGGDGIKIAMALLWERRHQCPGAFPVLVVHDEIVIEADDHQADAAAEWLRSAMIDAMAPLIDPIPVEVDVKIAQTWGGD
jgi:DNA polymerase-1